jgi:riboflavin kinase/FMN adenylyltransferase
MSAEDFIQRVLVDRLAAREVWVGEGFRFGHDRLGDLALLQRLGADDWMSADVVLPYKLDGERVSSSRTPRGPCGRATCGRPSACSDGISPWAAV